VSTALNRYPDSGGSEKRRSGRGKVPRQGISGNPQRRAEQLAQRRPAIADEPDLSSLRDLAYAMAGGSKPSPWWAESHQRIIAAARVLTWPSRLVDLETQTSRIVGDEFYQRLNSESYGMHSSQWLRALAEETGAELRTSVAAGTGDWPQLWALLCGLAAGLEHPADGARPAGDPLITCDAYGSRYLLVAPFGYDGEEVDHWYAWDIDLCWLPNVVGAGVFGSAQDALAEWQHAVGPAAGTKLSSAAPGMTARLLAPGLQTGPMAEMLEGSEPRELIREYYRLRRRAHALVRSADVPATAASSDTHDPEPVREAFLSWYEARHGDVPEDMADAVGTIIYKWGPEPPPEERSRYASSPHRIEMTARLIRDGYLPDHANEALRLLPEWTQWCIEQSGLSGDLAARSRAAALTEAAALVDEETNAPAAEQDEPPFRRQE
jgi:hypothetical protein